MCERGVLGENALRLTAFAQGTIRLASLPALADSKFYIRLGRLARHERAKRVEWWRRRESNPGPRTFPANLYARSPGFKSVMKG